MRKQIDFAVRVWKLGNGADGSTTGEALGQEIRELYLANDYEVFDVASIQTSGFAIMYQVTFVKWQEVPILDTQTNAKPK